MLRVLLLFLRCYSQILFPFHLVIPQKRRKFIRLLPDLLNLIFLMPPPLQLPLDLLNLIFLMPPPLQLLPDLLNLIFLLLLTVIRLFTLLPFHLHQVLQRRLFSHLQNCALLRVASLLLRRSPASLFSFP